MYYQIERGAYSLFKSWAFPGSMLERQLITNADALTYSHIQFTCVSYCVESPFSMNLFENGVLLRRVEPGH